MLFNYSTRKIWKKIARKEGLVNDDQNSKFFQIRADSRRKRKLVIKLRDDNSVWIDHQKMIADKFIADYTQQFRCPPNPGATQINLGPR